MIQQKIPYEELITHLSAVGLQDNPYASIHVRYVLSELLRLGLLRESLLEFPPTPKKISRLALVRSEVDRG